MACLSVAHVADWYLAFKIHTQRTCYPNIVQYSTVVRFALKASMTLPVSLSVSLFRHFQINTAQAHWERQLRRSVASYCRDYQNVIEEYSQPAEGAKKLEFSSTFAKNLGAQYGINFWRFMLTYWRTTEYNAVRYLLTCLIGLCFG